MLALDELIRTAGNVLLVPVALADMPGGRPWRRALVAGAKGGGAAAQAAEALKAVAPGVEIEAACAEGRWLSLWWIRQRRYDVACLLLTGQGGARGKLLAVLSGAPTLMAMGTSGQWYQLQMPPFRPLSLRWWARAVLSLLLCSLYLVLIESVLLSDAIWR